jgi:hypothetical protein
MAYDVLFVSEARLKKYTSLDENVRVETITPHILNSQDLYLQPVLGTKFYNHLKDGVKNDNLNSDELNFLDNYVAKAVMYYGLYLLLPHIKYKIVDKGLLNGSSEDTTTTTLEELKYLRQNALDTAEFFSKRMLEYLKDYPGMFPDYENPGTKGMYPDRTTPFFGGLQTKIPYKNHRDYYKNKDCDDCGFYGESSYTNPS